MKKRESLGLALNLSWTMLFSLLLPLLAALGSPLFWWNAGLLLASAILVIATSLFLAARHGFEHLPRNPWVAMWCPQRTRDYPYPYSAVSRSEAKSSAKQRGGDVVLRAEHRLIRVAWMRIHQ